MAVLPSRTITWRSSNGVGDPNNNWTCLVVAVDATEQILGVSNRVGEADFEAAFP
ncbi:MAG: hypothetical protein MUE60_08770 [Candidatus Eisenbacteria bacterium]|nr:hypothetical protein [Candidatus Eisenbacteria bacterium]